MNYFIAKRCGAQAVGITKPPTWGNYSQLFIKENGNTAFMLQSQTPRGYFRISRVDQPHLPPGAAGIEPTFSGHEPKVLTTTLYSREKLGSRWNRIVSPRIV